MTSDKKLELIKELVRDHKRNRISSLAAMIALGLIVDPKEPSKECMELAKQAAKDFIDRNSED